MVTAGLMPAPMVVGCGAAAAWPGGRMRGAGNAKNAGWFGRRFVVDDLLEFYCRYC
jgi:hypothetical protein